MGNCIPFSEIDRLLKDNSQLNLCLTDTSFLISMSDKDHVFHGDSQFLTEKFEEYNFKLFVSVTARSEFIDFHRRVRVTETLMDMLAPSSKWKISAAVREELKSQKGWLDNQAKKGYDPYLPDYKIKECKQVFLPRTQSGQIGWIAFCKEYLKGKLRSAWTEISDELGLNYVDMRASDAKELFRKELNWNSMTDFAEETALGSHDAMILNLFDCSVFPYLVTSDFDIAYGVMQGAAGKTVLVPDSLYRNQLKKLRF